MGVTLVVLGVTVTLFTLYVGRPVGEAIVRRVCRRRRVSLPPATTSRAAMLRAVVVAALLVVVDGVVALTLWPGDVARTALFGYGIVLVGLTVRAVQAGWREGRYRALVARGDG